MGCLAVLFALTLTVAPVTGSPVSSATVPDMLGLAIKIGMESCFHVASVAYIRLLIVNSKITKTNKSLIYPLLFLWQRYIYVIEVQ